MIRKSGCRFSLATNAERVCAEIMLKQKDGARMRHEGNATVQIQILLLLREFGMSVIFVSRPIVRSRRAASYSCRPQCADCDWQDRQMHSSRGASRCSDLTAAASLSA
jgi:hypothetical protein